jgi:hypothetical protein
MEDLALWFIAFQLIAITHYLSKIANSLSKKNNQSST